MKRQTRTMLAGLCAAGCLALTAGAKTFSDVPDSAWYSGAVAEVSETGLMNGTSATAFTPQGKVTRGMVAVVLWRLAGSPSPAAASPFPDVEEGDYFASAAAWAAENGVADGYGDGRFGGNDAVTREQLAVFLYRYSQFSGQPKASGVLDRYPDRESLHGWAAEGMAHAVGAGLITGMDDGKLDPLGAATRAQLAVILQRLSTPAVG